MANQSTTGFGLRPLRKVGQNDNNAGLGEFEIASGATAGAATTVKDTNDPV